MNGRYSLIIKTIDASKYTANEIIITIFRIKYQVLMNYLEELIRLNKKQIKKKQHMCQEFKKNVQYFSLIIQSPCLCLRISRSYQGELYPIRSPTSI
ncbi:hypothetical protein TTHERM_00058350 (macronuclear) [Tetrahymena thermophila SB210]|uniref:Uncharacterized protein n=1 Tax=Tetrahymena thermophila (strain SB210) TaxID=312017 RepID=I7MH80_TETTS|nr:hypothetical protein TTHERM_00058350 [Tetrahymena thermophila SB210]EAR87323.1 hypothetical protein TTHERM_00058350 [Tetrahymena thermophila SB210]|eukprot:XP_001007568.1 hypothetical protein TTHERM_00058350 [Tetrahymena thermophila SB210]